MAFDTLQHPFHRLPIEKVNMVFANDFKFGHSRRCLRHTLECDRLDLSSTRARCPTIVRTGLVIGARRQMRGDRIKCLGLRTYRTSCINATDSICRRARMESQSVVKLGQWARVDDKSNRSRSACGNATGGIDALPRPLGHHYQVHARIIPDSRINETRSFSTPGPLKVRSERTQMIRGFPIGSSWPFVSARRSSIHKSICGNDTTMTRKFKIFFN